MHVHDVLKYGHSSVLQVIEGLPEVAWMRPNVCGVWSTKDILAHLASFEQVLGEVLGTFLEADHPTPLLDQFRSSPTFNNDQVSLISGKPAREVLSEYETAHANVAALAERIPLASFRHTGALTWYGAEYDLEDFIIYTNYAHKREHCAQIKLFRVRLNA